MLRVLLAPLRVLPDTAHACLLSCLTNHLLLGQPVRKRLVELDGKVLLLHIVDLDIELLFRIRGRYLQPARQVAPDVIIRGDTEAFLSLALRREDPDTLFFQRRLSVEGETETGVHIKNLIDGFNYDLPGHFHAVLPPVPAELLTRLAERFGTRPSGRGEPHHRSPPMPGRPRQ